MRASLGSPIQTLWTGIFVFRLRSTGSQSHTWNANRLTAAIGAPETAAAMEPFATKIGVRRNGIARPTWDLGLQLQFSKIESDGDRSRACGILPAVAVHPADTYYLKSAASSNCSAAAICDQGAIQGPWRAVDTCCRESE